jgi:hypothetical protein
MVVHDAGASAVLQVTAHENHGLRSQADVHGPSLTMYIDVEAVGAELDTGNGLSQGRGIPVSHGCPSKVIYAVGQVDEDARLHHSVDLDRHVLLEDRGPDGDGGLECVARSVRSVYDTSTSPPIRAAATAAASGFRSCRVGFRIRIAHRRARKQDERRSHR